MPIFPYPENVENFMDFFRYVNDGVDGLVGVSILVIVGLIAFLSTKNYTYERALGFAGFLVLISGVFLRFLNLINDKVLYGCVVIFIMGVVFLFKERGVEEV